MNRENKATTSELRLLLTKNVGYYFLCPDGQARKFYTVSADETHLSLVFDPIEPEGQAMQYRWPTHVVREKWSQFNRISQQQAQGKTALPVVTPQAVAVDAVVVPLANYEQIARFIDPNNDLAKLTEGLLADFDKVGTTATYVNQATSRMQIAQTVIEVAKTRAAVVAKFGKHG